MRLLHHSIRAVPKVRTTVQDSPTALFYDKPKGLWVSVEGKDDWAHWCRSEDFGLGAVTHEVVLAEGARILYLKNAADIDEFTKTYQSTADVFHLRGILWSKVAEQFQGIIIAPYVWSRRMTDHTRWYYGWDCASGCIWDAEAISGIEIVHNVVKMS